MRNSKLKLLKTLFSPPFVIGCCLLILSGVTYGQKQTLIYVNGVRMSKFLTIKFNERILDLERGVRLATIDQIGNSHLELRSTLSALERRYGEIVLRKHIPNAIWGDVWRTHRRTGDLVKINEWSQLFYLIFPMYVPVDSIVANLRLRPEVKYAHAPVIAVSDASPNDPHYDGTSGTQWNLDVIEADKAWNITQGSSNVIVAIIEAQDNVESGLPDTSHSDFSNGGTSKFAAGGDSLQSAEIPGPHATGVAGIVGAATNNNTGIASLGWNVRMRPYRFDQTGDLDDDDLSLAAAIQRALDDGCDVMNLSFGLLTGDSYNPCGSCIVTEFATATEIDDTIEALDDASAMGVILVGSSGNTVPTSGNCTPCEEEQIFQPRYPAAYHEAIAVAATDDDDNPDPNYNQGEWIDVAAPGISVKTTSGTSIGTVSGTSFSSPLVASLAGLIKTINSNITSTQARTIIRTTADDIGYGASEVGAGRINAYEALKYTLENYGGTLSGNVLLTEDLTIASGKTLTVAAGTTIEFDSNVGLIINGTLNVDGESGDEVTFDRSGGTGDWDGIEFKSGSSGTIDYAIIDHVSNGDGIKIQSASPTIKNSTIKNCLWGISLNTSNAIIDDCVFENNDEAIVDRYGAATYTDNTIKDSYGSLTDGNGLSLIDTDPTLFRNVIEDNVTGVTATSTTLAEFGGIELTGNNVIRNNITGLSASGSSTYLRLGEHDDWGGDNSVYSNTGLEAIGLSSGWVLAEMTYWGSGSSVSGNVDDDYPLGSDPNQAVRGEEYFVSVSDGASNLREDPVFQLVQQRRDYRIGKKAGFARYLESIARDNTGTELGDVAEGMLAVEYYLTGDFQNALTKALANKNAFANSEKEKTALIVLFDSYLYGLEDKISAGQIITQLQSKHTDDVATKRLQYEFAASRDSNLTSNLGRELFDHGRGKGYQTLAENRLFFDIYPNPFNPNTVFQYTLPEDGNLDVRVFNSRGQLIRVLAQGLKQAGQYEIEWNGKNASGIAVSSGVYFYIGIFRFQRDNTRVVKQSGKITLLK